MMGRAMAWIMLITAMSACAHPEPSRAGPAARFEQMVASCRTDGSSTIRRDISRHSQAMLEEYLQLALKLRATSLPANPLEVLAAQLASSEPQVLHEDRVRADTVWVHIRYASGMPAKLRYIREENEWRFDLAREMSAAMEQLREAEEVLEIYGVARAAGRPTPRIYGDDDDD